MKHLRRAQLSCFEKFLFKKNQQLSVKYVSSRDVIDLCLVHWLMLGERIVMSAVVQRISLGKVCYSDKILIQVHEIRNDPGP